MSTSLSALVPELQPYARALIQAAGQAGLQPKITSTLRTHSEQRRLYDKFQRGLSPFPAAPPGESAHEFGLAFDIVLSSNEYLPDVAALWKQWGGVWGGEFNDPIHFEAPGWRQAVQQAIEAPDERLSKLASLGDFLLGFLPGVGVAQLSAALLSLGFPKSELFRFAASPIAWLNSHPGVWEKLYAILSQSESAPRYVVY